ncbi:MAG: DUF4239 domain-containing protein [Bryobacterales bacterium]|nr:DUF4239 domain-containing protein [Bryobacterales bacterium]
MPSLLPALAGLLAVMALAAWFARRTGQSPHAALDTASGLQLNGSMVATFYGVLLALILYGQISSHQDIESRLNHEAWEVLFLFRLGESVPDAPTRASWEAAVREVAQSVVQIEWPAMRNRHTQKLLNSGGHLDPLWRALMAFDPRDARAQLLLGRATESYAVLLESRRQRLNAGNTSLHPILWFGLIAGGFFTIFLSIFSAGPGKITAIAAAMSTGLVYLLLWLVAVYQRPFEGPLAISPAPYVRALEQMEAATGQRF